MSAVIEFDNVSKRFLLQHERHTTIRERLFGVFRPRTPRDEFWALRNVSFTVARGESFGLIGHNGAGKSTALKLMTRILEPTSGRVRLRGRVAALLELGSGFHPELTGRDNVFLYGSLMGLSRREMIARLDAIVAFAEMEDFLDLPVKHYSSGMYTRLAFAVATAVDPDILITDEVLAVGDEAFQRKCYGAHLAVSSRRENDHFRFARARHRAYPVRPRSVARPWRRPCDRRNRGGDRCLSC